MSGVSQARHLSYYLRMHSALPRLARSPTPSSANTLYRLVTEVSNGRDLNVLDSLVASNVYDHTPLPDQGTSRSDFLSSFQRVLDAFPDLRVDVLDFGIGQGGRIFSLLAESGTLRQPLTGMTRTGGYLRWRGLTELVVRNGLICEFSSMSTLNAEYERFYASS